MKPNQEVRMKKRRSYPKEFKARVALEALKETKTIGALSSEYEIHSNMVTNWKKYLRDNIADVFARKDEKDPDARHELDNLYRQIGRQQVEIDWLKKKLGF
jgi:transposase